MKFELCYNKTTKLKRLEMNLPSKELERYGAVEIKS